MTPPIARQVCLETNSKIVISASIAEAGNDFRIELDGLSCQSGRSIASVRNNDPSRTQIIHVLGVTAEQLRRELGEQKASVGMFNEPLEGATSASPEAVQLHPAEWENVKRDIHHPALPSLCPSSFALRVVKIGNARGCPSVNDF